MIKQHPTIVWCANSSHFIVENNLQYSFPVYLGLQLADHLRNIEAPYPTNIVRQWYDSLDFIEKSEVRIAVLN